MSTPNFDKGQGGPTGQPGSGGPADPFAPAGGADAYGPPAGYSTPAGYGTPDPYGPSPYGSPAPTGSPYGQAPYGSSGVVGPGGEWLGPPLASWGRRVGGYLIDSIVAGVVVGVLSAVDPNLGTLGNIAALVLFGYLTGTTGQTPGRQLLGTKVVRLDDGQVLGAGAGIGRQFLHVLDALPLLLGFLWPLWDKKNQTFSDKIIRSVVLKL